MSRKVIGRLAAVAVVVAVAAGGVMVGVNGSDDDKAVVSATFGDSSGVSAGFQVRAGGVEVGKVGDVRVAGNKAELQMSVDKAVLPLHSDATAWIRKKNLLGEPYIELNPGSPTAPEMDQPVIPQSQTRASVDLQDVLNSVDDPTGTSLAAFVTSLGEGLRGRGGDTAAALKALQPAMMDTNQVGNILSGQNATLSRVIDQVKPVAGALADGQGQRLDKLVGTTEQSLSAVAQNRQAIEHTLSELPSTIVSARRTLSQLTGTANAATPTLRDVRPVTDNLNNISSEIETLADSANPALGALQPVADKANSLLDQAAPVVNELQKAAPSLAGAANKLKPAGHELLDHRLGDLMDFVRFWSLSTNGKDGISHYFRGIAYVSPSEIQQLVAGAPKPVPGPQIAGAIPNVPALPSVPGAPGSPGLPGLPLGKSAAPSGQPGPGRTSATGLDPQQEQAMLSQLIGGR